MALLISTRRQPAEFKVNLDFMPHHYRRRIITRVGVAALIVFLLSGLLTVVLGSYLGGLSGRVSDLNADVKIKKAAVTRLIANEREGGELAVTNQLLQDRLDVLVYAGHGPLGAVGASAAIAAVFDSIPQGVQLQKVEQEETRITVQGTAMNYNRVATLSQALEESLQFESVALARVVQADATDTLLSFRINLTVRAPFDEATEIPGA